MSAEAALCFLGYCTDAKPSVQEDDKTKCANRSSLPVILLSSMLGPDGWTQTAWVLVLLLAGKAREQSKERWETPRPSSCWWEDTTLGPLESNSSVSCGCNEGSRCKDGWALQPVCWGKKVQIQLSHTWRSFLVGGDFWVSWRICHLDPAGYLDSVVGNFFWGRVKVWFFLARSQEQDVSFLYADFTHPSSVSPHGGGKTWLAQGGCSCVWNHFLYFSLRRWVLKMQTLFFGSSIHRMDHGCWPLMSWCSLF